MGVDLAGNDPSFAHGTGGLSGVYPKGCDGSTIFEHNGFVETLKGHMEPQCNSIGQEWQVRNTDTQLFRESLVSLRRFFALSFCLRQ